jgi:hypothetical protein
MLLAPPNVMTISPNRSNVTGGETMVISGDGFFPSDSVVVKVMIPTTLAAAGDANLTRAVTGTFAWLTGDDDDVNNDDDAGQRRRLGGGGGESGGGGAARGVVAFVLPQLPAPLDVDVDALPPRGKVDILATVPAQ